MIRPATPADSNSIARIYNHYIAHTIVTFEEAPVTPTTMADRLAEVTTTGLPWLVAEHDGAMLGYAYASAWRARSAYRYSIESTVYLDHTHARRGLGTALYGELLPLLQTRGHHVVIAGISLPNDGSIALHERCGFAKVAHFSEVGFKFERWVDVGYWQRTF